MSIAEKNKFEQWYDERELTNNSFNFQNEMEKYCNMDVKILKEVDLKFRKIFLEIGDVDHFLEASTVASTCNLMHRKNI